MYVPSKLEQEYHQIVAKKKEYHQIRLKKGTRV